MKLYYIFLSLIIICGCRQVVKQTVPSTDSIYVAKDTAVVVPYAKDFSEVITTDLNNDGKIDTITLSTPPEYGDPGIFQKIEIALMGADRQSFESKSVWDSVDNSFLKENKNAVQSTHVFAYKDIDQFVILLFGYVYGAGRSDFNVIYGKGAHFKMIFKDAFQTPMKLGDLNHDGKLELLGRETEPQSEENSSIDSLGPGYIATYDPFSIHMIDKDSFMLDEAATQKYNEQNYIWLGPDASENLRLYFFLDNRKPLLLK
ncbi:hypothetical protein SAMN05518672_101822 [Chitinophaga sp. CF118]|uniref:hypothetical protein n=1 Tax=Chitinophaga sp. CF118 TaxID=1884367 RepID=UPI0008F184F3|nr:hypothetical protein [Chitinophaga sp. CF118]SFD16301.1 hypothetical protein SAMN05518672_101822 [Chitinophaga sp. CF118]